MQFSSFFSGGFITAIVGNPPERRLAKHSAVHRGEFCHFPFSGFTTMAVMYPPEKKLEKCTSVQCSTGKSFSEALILASTNPQYDKTALVVFMVVP